MYGQEWLNQTYQYIIEDKKEYFLAMMSLFPLARTAMDEKSGNALSDYSKAVEKMFQSWTPWIQEKERMSALRRRVKSGTIVVIPDASDDLKDPLFKDAKILRR